MSLWNGTTLNTNETAMVFNHLANLKALPMVRKKHGFLFAVLGQPQSIDIPGAEDTPGTSAGFERSSIITGKNYELKLEGKLPTPTTTTDGANEVGTVTLSYVSDYYGAAEFALAKYDYTHPIPMSELDRFKGDEAKTASYLNQVFDTVMGGYRKTWATALSVAPGSNNGAPSRSVLGSYPFAIAGNNSGAVDWANNGGSYGTLNRADSGNIDFRGVYDYVNGDVTLAKIDTDRLTVNANGGDLGLGVCGTTIYASLLQKIQPYTRVDYSSDFAEFGSEFARYAGINFTLDPDAPANTMGLMDPTSWTWVQSKDLSFTSGVMIDPSRVSTYVLPTHFWVQLICKAPNRNALLTGITG